MMPSWFGVEPRHLMALVAVHEAGSFRGAAIQLGCVQSAVSQRVLQLEAIVGVQLVDRARGRSSVQLTMAGQLLVRRARTIMGVLGAAAADLRTRSRGAEARIRIGAFESVAQALLPGTVRRLSTVWPDLRLELRDELTGGEQSSEVAFGTIDVAFADAPVPDGPFAFEEILEDAYVLLVAADSPLARRERLPSIDELAALPLMVGSASCERWVAHTLRAAGGAPAISRHAGGSGVLHGLVAGGMGVAVQPGLAVVEDRRVTAIPLGGLVPPRRCVVYWHRGRRSDEAVQVFVRAVAAEARSLELLPHVSRSRSPGMRTEGQAA